jgi:deoxycytidylate deaminase
MGVIHKVSLERHGDNLPVWCAFSKEEVCYFMKMAKSVKEAENPCPSRQIGVVIADPRTGTLVSTGHNGPPVGSPANDNEHYLQTVFWPQLTKEEKRIALTKCCNMEGCDDNLDEQLPTFLAIKSGMGECPRRMIDAPSGKRLELCTCAHGETNAIVNAHRSVVGMWLFAYCGIPCLECTKLIVNAHIYGVVCLEREQDYSPLSSRWMLKHSRTNVLILPEDWLTRSKP